jgi:hypothetical protein
MGDFNELVSRASEEGEVLGAAFSGARLDAMGAVGDRIGGDVQEHGVEDGVEWLRGGRGLGQDGRPRAQGVEGSFEAEAGGVRVVEVGGAEHEGPNEVIGDEVHPELAADHGGGLATKDIGAESGFDVPEEELGAPAAEVEVGEGGLGVSLGVQEGGGQEDSTGAKAGSADADFEFTHEERVRQGAEQGGRAPLGTAKGFGAWHDRVAEAQSLAGFDVGFASLVEAEDGVDAASVKPCDVQEAAEGAVAEGDIAGAKESPQATQEGRLVEMKGGGHGGKDRAGGQGEQGDHPHDGEAASGLLGLRLGV